MNEIALPQPPNRWKLRAILVRQDLLVIVRQPHYLIQLLLPLLTAIIFSFVLDSFTGQDKLTLAIYDAGNSQLVQALRQQPELELQLVASETAVAEAVRAQARAGFTLPADFDTAVANQQQPTLTIILNNNAPTETVATLQRLVNEQLWQLRYQSELVDLVWQEVTTSAPPSRSLEGDAYAFLTFLLLGLVMPTLCLLPQMMGADKESHTLPSLFATAVSWPDLLIARGVAVFICTAVGVAILLLFDDSWHGQPVLTAVTLFLGTLVLLGVGTYAGLLIQTKQRLNSFIGLLGMLFMLPSWFIIIPVFSLSVLLYLLLHLLPTYYIAIIMRHIMAGGSSWNQFAPYLLALLAWIGLLFVLLRYQLEKRPWSYNPH